jgi:PadR family transcriptional regulator PadR
MKRHPGVDGPQDSKTLDMLGPMHGYGIARRVEQISGDLLTVNQGTLYPVLLKLEQKGSVASEWGTSENNRKARFYRLTRAGRRQLRAEADRWEQTAAIIWQSTVRHKSIQSGSYGSGHRGARLLCARRGYHPGTSSKHDFAVGCITNRVTSVLI